MAFIELGSEFNDMAVMPITSANELAVNRTSMSRRVIRLRRVMIYKL